ncbi:hypothetical protein BGW37DRAFT_516451 [Umbelopsis sp. PMI_123]|nr:hypothetical protein BGW37DRAFT_516451 [Umbelopsis sp. PMI_123]
MNSTQGKQRAQQDHVRAINIDTGVSPDYDHRRDHLPSTEYDVGSSHEHLGKSPDYKNSNRVFFTHHSACSCRGSGVGCDCAMSCNC